MSDARLQALFAQARTGQLTRRRALSLGLRLGIATPALTALVAAAPVEGAAPSPVLRHSLARRQEGGSGTLRVALGGDMADLDPHYAYNDDASMVCTAAYEMLLQYKDDTTDQFDPMLAQSWEANADGSVYTFQLPANAVFHDGTPCDAEAVKASFNRILQMAAPPYEASVAAVTTRFVTDINQIEVVDPATIRFNLGSPQPLFLAAMASEYGPFIVNTKVIESLATEEDPQAHEALKIEMPAGIGTGPYTFVEYLVGERMSFEMFPDYHGGWEGDEFEAIEIRIVPENATRRLLIEQGDVDALTFELTPNDVEALRSNANVQVLEYDTTRTDWIIMNVPRLNTVEVRQGFSFLFPYQEVIDTAYKGLMKRSGPIADTVKGADPHVYLYETDPVKAKDLILSGGFAEGDTFEMFVTSSDEVARTVAQLFQAKVAEIGFTLDVQEIDTAAMDELIYGDMPATEQPHFFGTWAWWPDYNDPWNQLYPNFTEASMNGGGSNAGDYVNARFEELMAAAEVATSDEELITLMTEAQQILTELDPPVIYIGQTRYYTILGKDIQGYVNNPLYLGAYPFKRMSRSAPA